MIGTYKILLEYKFGENVVHIEDVVVHRQWRNQSVGSKMLSDFIAHTNTKKDIYKYTLCCNNDVQEFYENLGFHHKGSQYCMYN
jgi:predicted GNAT family N-acyltransferase